MILTSTEMKKAEQAAVDSGISWLQLMEKAGCAAAEILLKRFAVSGKPIAILCGNGNNGGDGFVIARKFSERGAHVTVILTGGEPRTPQAAEMFAELSEFDSPILRLEQEFSAACLAAKQASLLVDAVYGIGFHGSLSGSLQEFFTEAHACFVPTAAIDIPSGLEADTGRFDPHTLRADITVTFTAFKPGLLTPAAAGLCGDLRVASIGIEEFIGTGSEAKDPVSITEGQVRAGFRPRASDANKGSFGRALLCCGSRGMMGAAVLAARASLRCGVGLTEMALPASLYTVAAAHLCEPVFTLLEETPAGQLSQKGRAVLLKRLRLASALGIGSGLGSSFAAETLVLDCLRQAVCPVVLDADGLNILVRHLSILNEVRAPLILTPHPGEMSRLTGQSISEIQANRIGTAVSFAERRRVIVVLKGEGTVVAVPGRVPLVNPTGNPGMATGGSGDVLTGIITSFLAQGMPPADAAMCAVYLHGAAGDRAAERLSQHAMLPGDLIDELGGLFLEIEKMMPQL